MDANSRRKEFFSNCRLTAQDIDNYPRISGDHRDLKAGDLINYFYNVLAKAPQIETTYEAIKSVVTTFVAKKGVKINKTIPIYTTNFRHTHNIPPLRFMSAFVKDDETLQAKNRIATYIIIAMLENGAGFSLPEQKKVTLVKNILRFKPEYIKTLIAKKFYIAPDFQIEGKPLLEYAQEQKVGLEIIDFIKRQSLEIDHVKRKKEKILATPILLRGGRSDETMISRFNKEMTRGKNTEFGATLVTSDESNANYMLKEDYSFSRAIACHYGTQILRAVSAKDFTIKSPRIYKSIVTTGSFGGTGGIRTETRYIFATKIDPAFTSQRNCQKFLSSQEEKEKPSSAAYFGASSVVGEWDKNQDNVRFSAKHGGLIAIDLEPFFNGISSEQETSAELRFVGSVQALILLKKLSGATERGMRYFERFVTKRFSDTAHAMFEKARGLSTKAFKTPTELQEYFVSDELLAEIKMNIARNPHHKSEFMAFMRGVERTIAISKDGDFLDALDNKYRTEIGENAFLEVKKCRDALTSNAQDSERIYKKYLEFYHELQERSLEGIFSKYKKPSTVETDEIRPATPLPEPEPQPISRPQTPPKEIVPQKKPTGFFSRNNKVAPMDNTTKEPAKKEQEEEKKPKTTPQNSFFSKMLFSRRFRQMKETQGHLQ